jgi:hypothetical protein
MIAAQYTFQLWQGPAEVLGRRSCPDDARVAVRSLGLHLGEGANERSETRPTPKRTETPQSTRGQDDERQDEGDDRSVGGTKPTAGSSLQTFIRIAERRPDLAALRYRHGERRDDGND